MTVDEAINELIQCYSLNSKTAKKKNEAISMAIEALEKQRWIPVTNTNGYTTCRKETIMTLDEAILHCEEVTNNKVGCAEDCANEHKQLAEWLKELKKRREKDRWIPASERLPEVGQAVVVTTKDGLLGFGKCFDAGHLAWYYHDIIAWTPFLLKPYREVNKNDLYTTFN